MLKKIIDTCHPAKPALPICHITTWHNFESIIENGSMTVDKNAGRDNLYFFYGLPFYKLPSMYTGQRFRRPIGLLFKSDLIGHASKIFPFDSGAFPKHFKPNYFPDDYSLETFELTDVDQETPGRLVSLLYQDNEKYIFGKPVGNCSSKETIIDCILDLITTKDKNSFDERNHGIEVVFSDNIKLKGSLELVLLPKTMYRENESNFNKNLSAFKLDFYEDNYRSDPAIDCSLVQAKSKEYLRSIGLLAN
jgi:hypothetical protein